MAANAARNDAQPRPASEAACPPFRIEAQVDYLLRLADQRASAIFRVIIGGSGVTQTQYSSLIKLHEYNELSQNHLGRLVGMDTGAIQSVIRRLKERRLVASRPHPGDARSVLVRLTAEGHSLISRLMIDSPAVSREVLKPLNAQEQRRLIELLSRTI